jgi:hypothetical protein
MYMICDVGGGGAYVDFYVGWIRNFAIRNFATKNYVRISINGHIISRNVVEEYREISQKIGHNFATHFQFGGLDPGHTPNRTRLKRANKY